jgi:hypothetical protein
MDLATSRKQVFSVWGKSKLNHCLSEKYDFKLPVFAAAGQTVVSFVFGFELPGIMT